MDSQLILSSFGVKAEKEKEAVIIMAKTPKILFIIYFSICIARCLYFMEEKER